MMLRKRGVETVVCWPEAADDPVNKGHRLNRRMSRIKGSSEDGKGGAGGGERGGGLHEL